jgi:pSer/pThr/pTyr-binding forkhead associated (FHA) protein
MGEMALSTNPAGHWVLRGTLPSGDPLMFRLRPGEPRTMGRAVRTDFIVEAPLVSRVHCRLHVTPEGHLAVEDLGSTNGTFVNGRRVERATLVPGDVLRAGRAELTVERAVPLPDATEP